MSRLALAAVSLVAAIPAAWLAVVAILAFVNHTENMGTIILIVNGAATAIGVLVALTPIIILVGKRRGPKEKVEAEPVEVGAASGSTGAQTAEIIPDEMPEAISEGELAAAEPAETDAFEFNADEFEDADSGETFEFDDEDEKV